MIIESYYIDIQSTALQYIQLTLTYPDTFVPMLTVRITEYPDIKRVIQYIIMIGSQMHIRIGE